MSNILLIWGQIVFKPMESTGMHRPTVEIPGEVVFAYNTFQKSHPDSWGLPNTNSQC
jgi:hypothetical protein